jgi:hypothetical protein
MIETEPGKFREVNLVRVEHIDSKGQWCEPGCPGAQEVITIS